MKKSKLLVGLCVAAPLLSVATALPIVSCGDKEPVTNDPIPVEEFIIKNGVIKGLKKPWSAYKRYSKIIIPKDIVSIDEGAFASNKENGTIPESIKYLAFEENDERFQSHLVINAGAFQNDFSLETIVFPKRTQYIGENAFAGCLGIKTIDFSSWDDARAKEVNPFSNENIFDGWNPHGGNVITKSDVVRDSLFFMLTYSGLPQTWFNDYKIGHYQEGIGTDIVKIYDIVNDEYAVLQKVVHTGTEVIDEFTVPETIKGGTLEVRGLMPQTFYSTKFIKKITISATSKITAIGANAFNNCSDLETVDFSASTKLGLIDTQAFYNCPNLTTIKLPTQVHTLKSIGSWCFANCPKLTSIDLQKSDVNEIMPGTFYDCKNLSSINFNNLTDWIGSYAFALSEYSSDSGFNKDFALPGLIQYIGDHAFECQSITAFPNLRSRENLKYIGDFAFSRCNKITTLIFPNKLEYFGAGAVSYMSYLTLMEVYDEASTDPTYITKGSSIILRKCEDGQTYSIVAVCYGSDPTKVAFPTDKVVSIDPYAFVGMDYTSLGSTIDLTSFNHLTTVGDYAFAGTAGNYSGEGVIKIKLPESVTTIGNHAFKDSTIDNLDFMSKQKLPLLTTWGDYVFEGCNKLTSVDIPPKITEIPKGTFLNCKSIIHFGIINHGVETIGDRAFEGCTGLTTIYLASYPKVPKSWLKHGELPFNIILTQDLTIQVAASTTDSEWEALFINMGIVETDEGKIVITHN
ncbi:MAG: leucine-rich repeat protein [Mycoplasmoidaceae bacterium]